MMNFTRGFLMRENRNLVKKIKKSTIFKCSVFQHFTLKHSSKNNNQISKDAKAFK